MSDPQFDPSTLVGCVATFRSQRVLIMETETARNYLSDGAIPYAFSVRPISTEQTITRLFVFLNELTEISAT